MLFCYSSPSRTRRLALLPALCCTQPWNSTCMWGTLCSTCWMGGSPTAMFAWVGSWIIALGVTFNVSSPGLPPEATCCVVHTCWAGSGWGIREKGNTPRLRCNDSMVKGHPGQRVQGEPRDIWAREPWKGQSGGRACLIFIPEWPWVSNEVTQRRETGRRCQEGRSHCPWLPSGPGLGGQSQG